jgi:hypothetical protein
MMADSWREQYDHETDATHRAIGMFTDSFSAVEFTLLATTSPSR